jgi:hypothetical protein
MQSCRSGFIESESGVLMTKNLEKNTDEKIMFLFLIKNCNLLIPRPPKSPSYFRLSLQPSKENIQHLKK